jgi:diaminopimelate decarboxylase
MAGEVVAIGAPAGLSSGSAPSDTSRLADSTLTDIASCLATVEDTPAWLYLPTTARATFAAAARWAEEQSSSDFRVAVAYSMKTNPDDRLIELARECGLLAETISQLEVRKALALGFPGDRIVLNGPAKWWPQHAQVEVPVHAVFCDSLDELRQVTEAAGHGAPCATIIGVRIRPPRLASRFGIDLTDSADRRQVADQIRALPADVRFGVHFHMGSTAIGLAAWQQTFESILQQARSLEVEAARPVHCLDVGGGWFPDDWTTELHARLMQSLALRVKSLLPAARELIFEPGRAVAQSSMALAMRVLEVRRRGAVVREVVVDGSIAEMAYHNYSRFPHRFVWFDQVAGAWRQLGSGRARILGRLCMEKDVLAEAIALPDALVAGDLLVACDAGAYDRSMSYTFGMG